MHLGGRLLPGETQGAQQPPTSALSALRPGLGCQTLLPVEVGRVPTVPPATRSLPGAPVTHSNRIAASAKNFLSKSQRKKRSRLEGGKEGGGSVRALGTLGTAFLTSPRTCPPTQGSPAQSQGRQEQHHKDEEGVTLVHSGPVLPGAGTDTGHGGGQGCQPAGQGWGWVVLAPGT